MSDENISKSPNKLISSIKETNLDKKASLEQINKILHEIKQNIIKESTSKNDIPNSKEEKNIKSESKLEPNINNSKDDENISEKNLSEGNDKIGQNNIRIIRPSSDYRSSMDINLINNIGIKKKKSKQKEQPNINIINNDINENNQNIISKKNKEYVYKDISELTESNIFPEELNSYNVTKGSEFYLNEIIGNLGGAEECSSNKDEEINNISQQNYNQNLIQEMNNDNNPESIKYDSKESIKFALTNNIQSDEKENTILTNELNKAYIKTKDGTSNISSETDIPRKLTKMSNNNKNNGIEMIMKEDSKKDENELAEEIQKEIYNGIDKVYESELNLVKINNKEKFSYITKYNDPDKDKIGYEPEFFHCSKNNINYLIRRNNFLNHKYFSYILSKNEKNEKDKKIIDKDDSEESNDDFIYIEEEVNKYKKNYKEKFQKITMDLTYIRANSQNDNIKEYKIYDLEDMTSFFYYFNLYSPEKDFKQVLSNETIKEIINSFTTYRKVLNDGNSFKRAFSYLLIENFILRNKIDKLDFIIYDIKRTLEKKFKDIKQICNVLIDIKENSSFDHLMYSYNNPNLNFDEAMISYIEETIKNAIGSNPNKRKYQEIDFHILQLLVNIFDINLEIFYIEGGEDPDDSQDNSFLKMKRLFVYNSNFLRIKKNIKASNYNEYDSSITFRLLFFLNSFYIVYTKKCDMDSTLANNNHEKQYYYISTLPKYICPTCKKNTGLDIIPQYEAIFCHICLVKYLQEILKKRAIMYVKSNFCCIEYYTRYIKITSDILITFNLYKYITQNYINSDFEKIVEKICFKCFEIIDKGKINKLNCLCQLCDDCLGKLLKDNLKDKTFLNNYELNTLPRTKCLCYNEVDLLNLMELSKNKPTVKDIKNAEERLIKILKKRCCLCNETDSLKLIDIQIEDGPQHLMCINCHDKELKKDNNIKNFEQNKFEVKSSLGTNDCESGENALKDKEKNMVRKKFSCKICFEEHSLIKDNILEHQKFIKKVKKITEGKNRCCKDKCTIV